MPCGPWRCERHAGGPDWTVRYRGDSCGGFPVAAIWLPQFLLNVVDRVPEVEKATFSIGRLYSGLKFASSRGV